ncbi:Cell division protein BolA [hydrothermal vent metagenome]|uniref:Cell division protein BolA n=1 Tax=hydrothermal vent metagenome TaxID=652676 RepID=A0A3B0RYB1_9ZZZZ
MSLGPVGLQMERKLKQRFAPVELNVIDESHHHAGHSGARPDGESHFKVKIVADAFAGQSLVQCHRLINETLAEELKERVHALSIQAKAP